MRISENTGPEPVRTEALEGFHWWQALPWPLHYAKQLFTSTVWVHIFKCSGCLFFLKAWGKEIYLKVFWKSKEDTRMWSLSSKCAEKSGAFTNFAMSASVKERTAVPPQVQYSLRCSQFFSLFFFLIFKIHTNKSEVAEILLKPFVKKKNSHFPPFSPELSTNFHWEVIYHH